MNCNKTMCMTPICKDCYPHIDKELGKGLGEIMGPELLEAFKQPGAAEIVQAWATETLRHHKNPLYKHAADYWLRTQAEQINKGAAKYPKPLHSSTYTFEQLAQHAMEENVDQAHYITAMREKGEEMRKCIELGEIAERALLRILESWDLSKPYTTSENVINTARGYFLEKKKIMEG